MPFLVSYMKHRKWSGYTQKVARSLRENMEDFINRDDWSNYYKCSLTTKSRDVSYCNILHKSLIDDLRKKYSGLCGIYNVEFTRAKAVHYDHVLHFGGELSDNCWKGIKKKIRTSWNDKFTDWETGVCELSKNHKCFPAFNDQEHLFEMPHYFAKTGKYVYKKKQKVAPEGTLSFKYWGYINYDKLKTLSGESYEDLMLIC